MPAPPWLEAALFAVHLLSVAAWFGALFYRTFVVDPRAAEYFAGRARDHEDFQLVLTHRARYTVLAALAVGGLSGAALAWLRYDPRAAPLLAAKAAVYALLLAGFAYVSWWLWPSRQLARADEAPAHQRHSRRVALAMLALLTAGMLLGVAQSRLAPPPAARAAR